MILVDAEELLKGVSLALQEPGDGLQFGMYTVKPTHSLVIFGKGGVSMVNYRGEVEMPILWFKEGRLRDVLKKWVEEGTKTVGIELIGDLADWDTEGWYLGLFAGEIGERIVIKGKLVR